MTVRLYGLLRLDTGLRELTVDAKDIRTLLTILPEEIRRRRPGSRIGAGNLKGCIVMVNGVQNGRNVKLKDGDTVILMSPAGGG